MSRKIVILTEGHTNPRTAKTAANLVRYRPDEVLGLIDSTQAGKTTEELLYVGGKTPIKASLAEYPQANALLLGIAPPAGRIPKAWRHVILEAISRGMDVISGLHDFLTEDAEFTEAAARHGVTLTDVRKNKQRTLATRKGLDETCTRILTVGNDCSVGKMVTAIEISEGLQRAGYDAKFVATGQTGIMVEGDGCPLDCVIADFVSGAAEQLVLDNQQHEFLLIEGQASLVHPAYSGVTLSLLHGTAPHAMILCYEAGRTRVTGLKHLTLPPLKEVIYLNEMMAAVVQPAKVIGISMNSRELTAEQAEQERARVSNEFGLPVVDVFRHGPDELVQAVLKLEREIAA